MGRKKVLTAEEYLERQRQGARASYHKHKEQNAEKFRLRSQRNYYQAKVETAKDDESKKHYEEILANIIQKISELYVKE